MVYEKEGDEGVSGRHRCCTFVTTREVLDVENTKKGSKDEEKSAHTYI